MRRIFFIAVLLPIFAPLFAGNFEVKEKIPAGTVLVMNKGAFSEERFVFTSETEGVCREFLVEHCKESEENPFGILYTQKGGDKKFVYDGKTGRIIAGGGGICGILVYMADKKSWFMYDDSVAFVRTAVKARKLAGAWGASRFGEPSFLFFGGGKCRINGEDCTYTESGGVFRVRRPYSQNFLYFLQKGNALFKGLGFLAERTEEK